MEHAANINGLEKGFIFSIHTNNITIKGMGDVIITGSYDPNTGNRNGQNLITVGGSGVTLKIKIEKAIIILTIKAAIKYLNSLATVKT